MDKTILNSIPPEQSISKYNYIEELQEFCPEIQVIYGLPQHKHIFQHPLPKLFFIDDQCSKIMESKEMEQLFECDSHHEVKKYP